MKRKFSAVSIISTLVFLLSVSLVAQTQQRGTWTLDREGKHENGKIQIGLRYNHKDQIGQQIPIADLKGLDPHSLDTSGAVKFQLAREAGTINFQGTINKGLGGGDFTFAANPDFMAKLKKMGFNDAEEKAIGLTMVDVTTAYIQELHDLGFKPDLDHVMSGRIFKVNREQVEGMRAVGFTGLSMDKLVECRIFDVSPEYVKEMRAKNSQITLEQLVESRIFKTTPEFQNELAKEGYPNLTQEQLTAFKIHNVTPQYIRQMRDLGFKDLTADRLVEFRIFNVGADQIRDLSKVGYKDLTAEQLVAFRIHSIDSAFIEKVKKAGYSHPSPDQLVEFKIMGIHKAQADI